MDPLLRRVERTAVAACVVMAALAWLVSGPAAAIGVLGGGVLAAVSYASIRSGVTALTAAMERAAPAAPDPDGPERDARKRAGPGAKTLLKVVLRYALLVLLAYVMIARLRLHPVGVVAGVSSVVAAAGIEAVRILVKKP